MIADAHKKDDAQPVCPNCGHEMVRARFQLEDGSWMNCYLCECPVDETSRIAGYPGRDVIHSFERVLDGPEQPDVDTPYDAFP